VKRLIPREYGSYLQGRTQSLLGEGNALVLRPRAFAIGIFLSFFLAIGAPYGNMIIRGSYMALDFSTPGAIFIFLLLIGPLNALFKFTATPMRSTLCGIAVALAYTYAHSGEAIDFYSPGFHFSSFLLVAFLLNIAQNYRGENLVLNRAELILVYVMLLIVSALCTMGLSEQILPMITAVFYLASPQNKWREKLFPQFGEYRILVDDGNDNKAFYEGLLGGESPPWESWAEPLLWWAIFFAALYATMICTAIILRRQWMERERLSYPITQVALTMVREEEDGRTWNAFLRRKSMWLGAALPLIVGSLQALHRYDPAYPLIKLTWWLPLVGKQTLKIFISFAMVGFSYFINANIAAGIWVFHILSKFEKEFFTLSGLVSEQKILYGVADFPLLAYQGVGALLAMVLAGLWVGREHYTNVWRKALGRAPEVDDSDEVLSYRRAFFGLVGGIVTMSFWLWLMGTPLWVAVLFVCLALFIFIGITRIVAEAGLATVRAPMIAPDLLVLGLGADVVGGAAVWNLSLAYMWTADVRVFVLANCTNALKLIEEMPLRLRRMVFWAMVLALLIGALGSFWMIFHMAYLHGGINLNAWFFKGAPRAAYGSALRAMDPASLYWPGWGFFTGGGLLMLLMMWARQRVPWWPVHPIGFPIGANGLMQHVWFSVFLAWLLKKLILRYGGATLYRRSQHFFLGLICGQALCNGIWLVIDYFTGRVGNSIFWI
jgi:hypothetical protein